MFSLAYDILDSIQVNNWYCGNITAGYAYSNFCSLNKVDQAKIRRRLKTAGYSCSFSEGKMYNLKKVQ